MNSLDKSQEFQQVVVGHVVMEIEIVIAILNSNDTITNVNFLHFISTTTNCGNVLFANVTLVFQHGEVAIGIRRNGKIGLFILDREGELTEEVPCSYDGLEYDFDEECYKVHLLDDKGNIKWRGKINLNGVLIPE